MCAVIRCEAVRVHFTIVFGDTPCCNFNWLFSCAFTGKFIVTVEELRRVEELCINVLCTCRVTARNSLSVVHNSTLIPTLPPPSTLPTPAPTVSSPTAPSAASTSEDSTLVIVLLALVAVLVVVGVVLSVVVAVTCRRLRNHNNAVPEPAPPHLPPIVEVQINNIPERGVASEDEAPPHQSIPDHQPPARRNSVETGSSSSSGFAENEIDGAGNAHSFDSSFASHTQEQPTERRPIEETTIPTNVSSVDTCETSASSRITCPSDEAKAMALDETRLD